MSVRDDTIAASKLTRTEFAVVRAYAQGMPAVEIANRYLLDPDDDDVLTEHQAVQRILTLRDRLVQFALQNDRPDIAAMFDSLKGRSNVAMDRRVDALSSLERLAPARPALEHAVSLWFRPSLAQRLSSAGLARIEDLVRLINRRGTAWWRAVPRLGRKSAGVVAGWLSEHRPGLQPRQQGAPAAATGPLILAAHIGAPPRPRDWPPLPATPLDHRMPFPVPLEAMKPSSVGTATAGAGYAVQLAEELQLVTRWLEPLRSRTNTWASYRRETERLLLWSAMAQRSLRSLQSHDIEIYLRFLADPQPASFWQGPASARDRMHWRPFEGGLGDGSRQAASRVLHVLFNMLRRCGVMAGNPCSGRGRPVKGKDQQGASASTETGTEPGSFRVADDTGPSVTPAETEVISSFANWLQDGAAHGRLRAAAAAVQLAFHFRLGVGQLVSLRCADLDAILARRDAGAAAVQAVRLALLRHWEDRGIGEVPAAAHPVLGPERLPQTPRARTKLAGLEDPALAGYSRGGMEALLRRAWEEFAEQAEDGLPAGWRFTPRALTRASC
ncbi:phage integrase family protein [Paracidovorax citrulli]